MAPIGFPIKLWKLLRDSSSEIIRWNDDGTAVIVDEPLFDILVTKYYPTFLRTPTVASLRRLFHWYYFRHTVLDSDNEGMPKLVEYSHPNFMRSRQDLIELVIPRYSAKRFSVEGGHSQPVRRAVRNERGVTPLNDTSMYSLTKLSSFRLPHCLRLDEDSDDQFWRPAQKKLSPPTSVGGRVILERLKLTDCQQYRGATGVEAPMLPLRYVDDDSRFSVKLRSMVQSVTDANRPSVYAEDEGDSDNDDEENVDCQQPVVPSYREKVHVTDFGDESTTWFGLLNEPVAREVEYEERNFKQIWEVEEPQNFADLVTVVTVL
jgi:hypothetical protein